MAERGSQRIRRLLCCGGRRPRLRAGWGFGGVRGRGGGSTLEALQPPRESGKSSAGSPTGAQLAQYSAGDPSPLRAALSAFCAAFGTWSEPEETVTFTERSTAPAAPRGGAEETKEAAAEGSASTAGAEAPEESTTAGTRSTSATAGHLGIEPIPPLSSNGSASSVSSVSSGGSSSNSSSGSGGGGSS